MCSQLKNAGVKVSVSHLALCQQACNALCHSLQLALHNLQVVLKVAHLAER